MGADTRQRGYLKDLLATTQVWEDWTGLADEQERRSRIVWPAYPGENQLPAITIPLGSSSRVAYPPGAGKSGFRASGVLAVLVFEKVIEENSLAVEEERVAGLVSDLLDSLVTHPDLASGQTRMRIARAYFEPNWLTRTNLNTEMDSDEPESAAYVGGVWRGMFFVEWGPFK